MGSGKGNVEEWAAVIKPGRIIFEMDGMTKAEAFEALRLANNKLPVKCKPISKESEALAQAALKWPKRQGKRRRKKARCSAAQGLRSTNVATKRFKELKNLSADELKTRASRDRSPAFRGEDEANHGSAGRYRACSGASQRHRSSSRRSRPRPGVQRRQGSNDG